jgi:hypothetical protein
MPLVFAPSNPMPDDEHELRAAYWYAVWDRPIVVPVDLQPGGTIYLYDDRTDRLAWRTTVVDTIAVPFEHVDDFRRLLTTRWQVPATELRDAPTPGFGIAWRAEPDELLLTPRPPGVPALHIWDATGHLDPAIAAAWGVSSPRCAADEAKRAGGGAASARQEPTSA